MYTGKSIVPNDLCSHLPWDVGKKTYFLESQIKFVVSNIILFSTDFFLYLSLLFKIKLCHFISIKKDLYGVRIELAVGSLPYPWNSLIAPTPRTADYIPNKG